MKKVIGKLKAIPWWGWALGVLFVTYEATFYNAAHALSVLFNTISYSFSTEIEAIDALFPFVPWTIIFYFLSFAFWVLGSAVVSLTTRENFLNYTIAMLVASTIGGILLTFLPTYMDRAHEGIMWIVNENGVIPFIYKVMYFFDGGDLAYNLMPSFHCMMGAFCYLGVRRQEGISKAFRIYSLVGAIIVCLSTLYTKQHFFMDAVTGILLAVVCWYIVCKFNLGKKVLEKKKNRI